MHRVSINKTNMQLNNMQLVEELKKLCSNLDDKYNVNSGGCMYLSYVIAKNLKKLGMQYDVILWEDCNNDPYHMSIAIGGEDINPIDYVLHERTENLGEKDPQFIRMFNNENEMFDDFWKKSYKRKVREAVNKLFLDAKVVDSIA